MYNHGYEILSEEKEESKNIEICGEVFKLVRSLKVIPDRKLVSVQDEVSNKVKIITAFFLTKGVKKSLKESEFYLFQTSVFYGNCGVVEHFLEKGFDSNYTDEQGKTLLMLACESLNPEMVKLLIEYNADIKIKDVDGKDAYHYAKKEYEKSLNEKGRSASVKRQRYGEIQAILCIEKENLKLKEKIQELYCVRKNGEAYEPLINQKAVRPNPEASSKRNLAALGCLPFSTFI